MGRSWKAEAENKNECQPERKHGSIAERSRYIETVTVGLASRRWRQDAHERLARWTEQNFGDGRHGT